MEEKIPKTNKRKISTFTSSQNASFDLSLIAYLKEISNITPLKKEEEHLLGKKIQKGDEKSLNELVRRNLKYVVRVAKAFRKCGLSLLDLISEGNVGLMRAATRFDPFRDIKFITYANWWIRQAIMHAVAEQSGIVKLPVKQTSFLNKINAKHRALLQKFERSISPDELSKEVGLSTEETESILRAYRTHLSLNAPLVNDSGTNYIDLMESKNIDSVEKSVFTETLKYKIDKVLKELPPREEKVLRYRFGFCKNNPLTLEEIGKKMNLSRERIRQIEKKATTRLRSKTKLKILEEFIS